MKKIISLFQRNYDGDRLVRDVVVPGAEWVLAGEGVATRKWDGTCCMVRDGKLYKRHDAKRGKTPPPDFEPAQDYDEVTGHMPGWIPVGDGPEDRWHREGFRGEFDGTYELLGPKVQGDPEGFGIHLLVSHGRELLPDAPRTFAAIREYLSPGYIEGIVWHHPDGRMVKIKARDFGFKRRPRGSSPQAGGRVSMDADDPIIEAHDIAGPPSPRQRRADPLPPAPYSDAELPGVVNAIFGVQFVHGISPEWCERLAATLSAVAQARQDTETAHHRYKEAALRLAGYRSIILQRGDHSMLMVPGADEPILFPEPNTLAKLLDGWEVMETALKEIAKQAQYPGGWAQRRATAALAVLTARSAGEGTP